MLEELFASQIHLANSFFSIFRSGGGTIRHDHVTLRDRDPILPLAELKYSLVYYLEVGDQGGEAPGFFEIV